MTFLFSEAVRVETKVGRMLDWKGQQRHLSPSLTGLTPSGQSGLKSPWALATLTIPHSNSCRMNSYSSQDGMEAPKDEIPP